MTYTAKSITDLAQIASTIKEELKYKVICFEGEMGAGKTTFIKELVKVLGSHDDVTSPTFSLVNEYETTDNQKIYHFDLYRLEDEEEALDIGIEDYLYSNYYCLIEWPNKITNFVPEEHHTITIEVVDGIRQLTLDK